MTINQLYRYVEIVEDVSTLLEIAKEVNNELKNRIHYSDFLNFFNSLSHHLLKDTELTRFEGLSFLSSWLKKGNLQKILEKNIPNLNQLECFVGDRKKIKAQPRGTVCHWVAGNVPTLTVFSVFQSLLVGNVNIARISKSSLELTEFLLSKIAEFSTDRISGTQLLRRMRIIYFPSENKTLQEQLSLLADARVIWGGREAVDDIRMLPVMSHCEDIIFGPKYSFGVIDKLGCNDPKLETQIRRFVNDIVFVEQSGCSSPHVIFIEDNIEVVVDLFANEFRKASKRYPKNNLNDGIASKIIQKRADHAMQGKNLSFSKELDWTILIDNNLSLEDPIQSRTLWIKQIKDILDVEHLITKEVQTIGAFILDEAKGELLADKVSLLGVARIVAPGLMNIYDSPWDGILLMNRLVRWITYTIASKNS